MDKLEHKIKKAFDKKDSESSFSGKEAMWNRLDANLHERKGVAAFWRIAAVFLGLLLTLGVLASINNRAKQRIEIERANNKIERLQAVVDSMLIVPPVVKTEVQLVEKEKVVYRDRIVERSAPANSVQAPSQQIKDSIQMLQNTNAAFMAEIQELNEELIALKSRLASENTESSESVNPFELKSDRVELGVQKKPSVKTPDLEMKVFEKNFIENRNNLNSTIFKK
nr:hypothetical protein [uncultured Draconibacterium sp.]